MHTTEQELRNIGLYIGQKLREYNHYILLLTGELGAGKTTLSQSIGQGLGISSSLQSPTYTIGNTYTLPHTTLFHLDLYRIKDLEEYLSLGFHDDLLLGKGLWIIEWPELLMEELQTLPYDHIHIGHTDTPEQRVLTLRSQSKLPVLPIQEQ